MTGECILQFPRHPDESRLGFGPAARHESAQAHATHLGRAGRPTAAASSTAEAAKAASSTTEAASSTTGAATTASIAAMTVNTAEAATGLGER